MRRRNLMIGLGVLATGSGATALTGATLSNTVSPTADFRVNVDTADLIVRRNGNSPFNEPTKVDTSASDNDITDGTMTYDGGGGSALDDVANFAAAANEQDNGNLEFGVLVPFDKIPTSGNETSTNGSVTYRFPKLLEVQNRAAEAKNIVVRYDDQIDDNGASNYGYVTDAGRDIDGGGTFVSDTGDGANELSYDEVAHIFEISVEDSNNDYQRISPTGDNSSAGNSDQAPDAAANISSDGIANLAVTVNLDNTLGQKIVDNVEEQGLDASGGQIRFLDQVWFSTTESPSADTNSNSFTAFTR